MKFFKTSLFILTTAIMLSGSRSSQAAIGAIASAPVIVTAGLVSLGTGAISGLTMTAAIVIAKDLGKDIKKPVKDFVGIGSAILIGAGLILLEGQQSFSYSEITQEDAQDLGITESERLSFNSQIDEVNAVNAQVTAEVSSIEDATAEDAKAVWETARSALSPEAFSALQKVTLQLYQ